MTLQVHFVGEGAVDAGGVKKEFFMLLLKDLLDPKYGMFRYYEESRLIWFNADVSFRFLTLSWVTCIVINVILAIICIDI